MPSSASSPPLLYPLSLHDALPISIQFRGESACSEPLRPAWARSVWFRVRRPAFLRDWSKPSHHEPWLVHRRQAVFAQQVHELRQARSEEHTSELQSPYDLVCRLLLRPPPCSTLFPYTTLFRSRFNSGASRPVRNRCAQHGRGPFGSGCAGLRSFVIGPSPHTTNLGSCTGARPCLRNRSMNFARPDRKSTRLNSSHRTISYAVFCFVPPPALPSFPTRRSSDLDSIPGRVGLFGTAAPSMGAVRLVPGAPACVPS